MIEMFTYFGMCVAIAIGIFAVTGIMGWVAGDDDDCTLRWIMTCIFYAITTTILINLLIK